MFAAITTVLSVATLIGLVRGCSITTGVATTFYGAPDNDPPGTGTAYNCGGRNFVAGGTGTYANPLTFASAAGEYNSCEIVYFPYLKKYLRYEDYCQQCTDDWASGIKHIDIWTGSANSGGQAQINCENSLTPDPTQSVIRNPATNLVVDSGALWDGSCHTARTYPSYTASTYCSGGGGTCQTGCSWAGHCIGCPCVTFDDCSGNYVCTNGLCAA